MTNPPQPLEACNSREEIEAWLKSQTVYSPENGDDHEPLVLMLRNISTALKRMEEVAMPTPVKYGSLQLVAACNNDNLHLAWWDGPKMVDCITIFSDQIDFVRKAIGQTASAPGLRGALEQLAELTGLHPKLKNPKLRPGEQLRTEICIDYRDQKVVHAALATAPEAPGGEVAVIKLNAEECEELHKILQSPEALRPGVMELIATAPALNADEVPAPLGFSYATSADLMRELGSQNPEKDGAVLDGIASGKVVELPKRARPTDGGK